MGEGTDFVRSQLDDRMGLKDVSERKSELVNIVRTQCVEQGVENIRHHAYLVDNDYISAHHCSHFMGESLLHGLVEIMGEEAMSSALNEIYVSSGGHAPALRFSTPPSEEEIFEAFIRYTAAERQGEVRELFQRFHGGDFAFPEIDYDDAEADRPPEAADVGVGKAVTGSLDYIFDFDFFRFEAEAGQRYRFSVKYSSLNHSSINLYGPNGLKDERERWLGRDNGPDGPLLLWQAPSSGVYYFAVQNFGGKSGEYTFTIEPVETDDHGDTPESATEVSPGLRVSGNIDHSFDYDYFSFSAREGLRYLFEFNVDFPNQPCADLYYEDGTKVADLTNHCEKWSQSGLESHTIAQWIASQTGLYYLGLYGNSEEGGEYEFEINQSG